MPRGQSDRQGFSLGDNDDGVNVVVGERIGNQTPPPGHWWVPPYTDDHLGDKAMWFLNAIGFHLDQWQELVLRDWLKMDDNGKWAAEEAGLLVPRQSGKGIRCAAQQFTINRGWIRFGDIQVGDIIPHPSGGTTKVKFKSDIHNLDCYRVTTTDGRTEIFDGDHLWEVTDKCRGRSIGPRGNRVCWFEKRVVDTRTMFHEGVSRGVRKNGHFEGRFQLPRQHALLGWDKRDLPVDPYLFGAWLGDGHSSSAALTCADEDVTHWQSSIIEAGYFPVHAKYPNRADTLRIRHPLGRTRGGYSFTEKLRSMGVLGDKHIPDEFLTASELQREALLQGLMDTDGCCDTKGRVEFCSTKKELAEGVLFLARSLGWRATLKTGRATLNGKDCGTKYRVCWTPVLTDEFVPFRLPRKLARVKAEDGNAGRNTISIKSIEPVESEPTVCIQVDADDELFIAGRDLIPTHNTAVIEARELVGLYIIGEKLCLHTSVLFNSARESFYRNKAIIENFPPLKRITKFREGNDNLGITIKDCPEAREQGIVGNRVVYMARGTANARGWSADVIVLDEGFALTDDIMAGIDYATSARRNPFVIVASSTGMEESETLLKIRDRGLKQDPNMVFHEWCATSPDPDVPVDLDDVEKWYEANPALGIRIPFKRVANERKRHSARAFGRERLGLWADNSFRSVISPTVWRGLCGCSGRIHSDHKIDGVLVGDFNTIVGAPVVAIDSDPLGENTTVALAGWDSLGRIQVEVLESGHGVSWAKDYVDELLNATQSPPPEAVVVQTGTTAGRLFPELEALGVKVIPFGVRDVCDACKHFYDRAMDGSLVHLGDVTLAEALDGATKIHLGRMGGSKEEPEYRSWYWGRRDTNVNITGLCAVTWAAWGLTRVWAEHEAVKEEWVDKPRGGGIW